MRASDRQVDAVVGAILAKDVVRLRETLSRYCQQHKLENFETPLNAAAKALERSYLSQAALKAVQKFCEESQDYTLTHTAVIIAFEAAETCENEGRLKDAKCQYLAGAKLSAGSPLLPELCLAKAAMCHFALDEKRAGVELLNAAADGAEEQERQYRARGLNVQARAYGFVGALLRRGVRDKDVGQFLLGLKCLPAMITALGYNEHSPGTIALWKLLSASIVRENAMLRYVDQDGLDDRVDVAEDWALLVVLKGWSSTVPLIAHAIWNRAEEQPSTGGGFFIRWQRVGLAVDPGAGFVTNMNDVGVHIRDIAAVITSHDHLDHNADLERLHNLATEYAKHASDYEPITYFLDRTTHKNRLNVVEWGQLGGKTEALPDPGAVQECRLRRWDGPDYPYQIECFPVQHSSAEKPLGFTVGLLKDDGDAAVKVGYTGDTEAPQGVPGTEEPHPLYEALRGTDLIVLNFSKTSLEELAGSAPIARHLGYNGCKCIIEHTDAPVYVISEWSAEMGDIRFEITQMLQEKFQKRIILPGDVGMLIGIEPVTRKVHVRCGACGDWEEARHVRVVRPSIDYGRLQYRCRFCVQHTQVQTKED